MKWAILLRDAGKVQNNNVDQSNLVRDNAIVYSAGTGQLTFYLEVLGSHGKTYTVQISFKGIDELTPNSREEAEKILRDNNFMMVQDGSKNNHIIHKPDLTKDDVQIRCTCPSFRFSYAYQDKQQKALFGRNFPPYHRKTKNRPPRNPRNLPGICKHIIVAMENLIGSDMVLD